MYFSYFDQSRRDRSKTFRAFIVINRALPELIHESVIWRVAKMLNKEFGIAAYCGKPGFTRWGRNVACVGDGQVSFYGSFAVGDMVNFEVFAPASITIADRVKIATGALLHAYTGTMEIGERVYIGPYSFLQSESSLKIGPDTSIGPHTNILAYTLGSERGTIPYFEQPVIGKGITIGKNVRIGASVTILDGVSIEDDAIVGAGAVVTKNVRAGEVVVGVPARSTSGAL